MKEWLTRLFREHRPHTALDLLAPPILTEVVISVRPNGERTMFVGKHEGDRLAHLYVAQSVVESGIDLLRQVPMEQAEAERIVRGLMGVGLDLAKQYGFAVNVTQQPKG